MYQYDYPGGSRSGGGKEGMRHIGEIAEAVRKKTEDAAKQLEEKRHQTDKTDTQSKPRQ